MKISKYLHSCLLLEQDGQQLLFDPGKFTFVEGLVTPAVFKNVGAVLITHAHPDHLDLEALRQIVALSGAVVISNAEVAAKLKPAGLAVQLLEEGVLQRGAFKIQALPVRHEAILDSPLPQMTAFFINDQVLNPADSFAPNLLAFQGVELLVLPVMAPFLTELVVAEFGEKMHPRQILPVHDGYAKPFFLRQRYETYQPHFEKLGIRFHALLEVGDSVEV